MKTRFIFLEHIIITLFAVAVTQGYTASIDAKLGRFFKYEINFANFVSNVKNASVSFTVSQLGFPDLPDWIRIEQRVPTDPAFLYGSPPPGTPDTVQLEVTGWNKRNYDTKRTEILITVDSSQDAPRYRVEFHVKDQYIYAFLKHGEPDKFLKKVKKVWKPDGGPHVSNVYSGLDRGERVPIPPNKESVYVEVGGSREYTAFEEEYTKCKGLKNSSNVQFKPFLIDWCKFTMRDLKQVKTDANTVGLHFGPAQAIFPSMYSPVAYDSSARDFGKEWALVLLLPMIIVLIIVIVLAIAMCCYREGRPKRDTRTPGDQLSHHESILRATFRLRQMSSKEHNDELNSSSSPPNTSRPQPQLTSTPYNHGQTPYHDSAQDDTDAGQRYAPPPYRMPPPSADTKERPPPFMSSQEVDGRQ